MRWQTTTFQRQSTPTTVSLTPPSSTKGASDGSGGNGGTNTSPQRNYRRFLAATVSPTQQQWTWVHQTGTQLLDMLNCASSEQYDTDVLATTRTAAELQNDEDDSFLDTVIHVPTAATATTAKSGITGTSGLGFHGIAPSYSELTNDDEGYDYADDVDAAQAYYGTTVRPWYHRQGVARTKRTTKTTATAAGAAKKTTSRRGRPAPPSQGWAYHRDEPDRWLPPPYDLPTKGKEILHGPLYSESLF